MNDARRHDELDIIDDSAEPIFDDDEGDDAALPEPPTPHPAAPTTLWRWLKLIAVYAGFFVLCGWLFGRPLVWIGIPKLIAYPLGSILPLILLAAFVCLIDKKTRRLFRDLGYALVLVLKNSPQLFAQLVRESESADFRAARRAAGSEGHVTRQGQLTIWSDMPESVDATIEDVRNAASKHFFDITGLEVSNDDRARLLCFNNIAAFEAYTRRFFPSCIQSVGYYSGIRYTRIVMRGDYEIWTGDFQTALALQFASHFLRFHFKQFLCPWSDGGIATEVAARAAIDNSEPNAENRILRSQRLKGHLHSGEELVGLNYADLSRRAKDLASVDENEFYLAFHLQCASFCRWLRQLDANAFRQLLLSQSKLHLSDYRIKLVKQHFRRSPDELMKSWESRCLDPDLPDFQMPGEDLKRRIDERLLRPIQDESLGEQRRREIIRRFGCLGYPWRCNVLIDLLANPNENIRDEAALALANLSGRNHGTDREAWTRWYKSLPESWHDIPGERPV